MADKPYFRGIPTDIDLKKLMEAFGSAKPGDMIAHEDVAATIGAEYGSNRYRTVVSRWRKAMFATCNLELEARIGVGYAVLNASERVRSASDDFKRVGDRLRKVHFRFAAIPRTELSAEEARRADHAQVAAAKLCDDFAGARKQVEAPRLHQRDTVALIVDARTGAEEAAA